jgi:hypothetical protein
MRSRNWCIVYCLRTEIFCVESLSTRFFHISSKKAKRQAATPNAKLPLNPAVASA